MRYPHKPAAIAREIAFNAGLVSHYSDALDRARDAYAAREIQQDLDRATARLANLRAAQRRAAK